MFINKVFQVALIPINDITIIVSIEGNVSTTTIATIIVLVFIIITFTTLAKKFDFDFYFIFHWIPSSNDVAVLTVICLRTK